MICGTKIMSPNVTKLRLPTDIFKSLIKLLIISIDLWLGLKKFLFGNIQIVCEQRIYNKFYNRKVRFIWSASLAPKPSGSVITFLKSKGREFYTHGPPYIKLSI